MAADLVERWQDVGPVVWVVAGALALGWFALLGVLAAITEPRRVTPGAATLELAGSEPPAVVNLVASDWELGHEAVPATLIDLAARRHVSIDQIGGRTLVRARARRRDEPLTAYEQMVFDHVRRLGEHTEDGFVPSDALTTGPEANAKGWWKRFAKEVHVDARARGLSTARWSPAHRLVLIVAGVVVAAAVALAASTLDDDPDDPDDDPATLALALGGVTAVAAIVAAGALRGERDTPVGRDAAAGWLGLRSMLASDPLFAEQGPAAVAVWDHHLAHGAALGVAHGAVHALPLGAESDRQAWSPTGGRWRLVRIRYPRRFPPGYGQHPAFVALKGLVSTVGGIALFPASVAAAQAVRDVVTDNTADHTLPPGVRLGISLATAAVAAIGGVLVAIGATMLVAGVGDLVRGRRPVEGLLVRLRLRGSDDERFWHAAVDDGTSDRVRAWRLSSAPAATQGATVAASVSPWLRHVRDFRTMAAAAAAEVQAMPEGLAENVVDEPTGPPPALPDESLVSAVLGRTVRLDRSAPPYPLARQGASAVYRGDGGLAVQVVWLPMAPFEVQRRLPKLLYKQVDGLGDEAYRMRFGGALTTRRDRDVLLVMMDGADLDNDDRDRLITAVATAALER